jgi:hypothetical protein
VQRRNRWLRKNGKRKGKNTRKSGWRSSLSHRTFISNVRTRVHDDWPLSNFVISVMISLFNHYSHWSIHQFLPSQSTRNFYRCKNRV